MAVHESALSELAERFTSDTTLTDAIADLVAAALQDLIEAELSAKIGAEPGERTPTRSALRNGHRPKPIDTPAGAIEIGIPKLREGSFFPELLEP